MHIPRFTWIFGFSVCFGWVSPLVRGGESEFVSMFNGRDLSGWVNVNCAPETWTIVDGMIHCTGIPTGALRTERQYENFIMELEWRHLRPKGNAGIFLWSEPISAPGQPFLRAVEVQVLENDYGNTESYTTHGDVFPIHGSTMKPFPPSRGMRSFPTEQRSKPSPEWNHYRIVATNGVIRLSVNGKEVSGGSECRYRKGYLALESEGSPVQFRNLKIQELPSTCPSPEEIAPLDAGFVSLYNGLDLRGWKEDPGHHGHWVAKDWTLVYDGRSEATDPHLWTLKSYRNFEMICDWRWIGEGQKRLRPVILPNGNQATDSQGKPIEEEVLDAGDSGIYLRGNSKSQVNMWCWPVGSGEVYGYRTDSTQSQAVRSALTPSEKADRPIGQWNRFYIRLVDDRLWVTLNGVEVIQNALLPEIPKEGPIALQHHGDAIQFASLYIKELP